MCCSSFDPIVKGPWKKSISLFVSLTGVLKEFALPTLLFLVLEQNLFPSRLTWGLERSLFASIFDRIFDCVGIILASCDACLPSIRGVLKWVNICDCFARFFPCACWLGSWKELQCPCFPNDSYAICTKEFEMSQLMSVLLISALCVNWGLERSLSVHFSNDSYAIYI